MSSTPVLVAAIAVVLTLSASACVGDNFAEYDVVNLTDQELLTWATTFDCGDEPGHKEDYLDEEVVPPHSTYHYGHSNFGPLKCAYVAMPDRRIILADSRTYDSATFTITEPIEPSGDPIPKVEELPSRTVWENWDPRGGPPIYWAFLLLVGGGVLAATWAIARASVRALRRARIR